MSAGTRCIGRRNTAGAGAGAGAGAAAEAAAGAAAEAAAGAGLARPGELAPLINQSLKSLK